MKEPGNTASGVGARAPNAHKLRLCKECRLRIGWCGPARGRGWKCPERARGGATAHLDDFAAQSVALLKEYLAARARTGRIISRKPHLCLEHGYTLWGEGGCKCNTLQICDGYNGLYGTQGCTKADCPFLHMKLKDAAAVKARPCREDGAPGGPPAKVAPPAETAWPVKKVAKRAPRTGTTPPARGAPPAAKATPAAEAPPAEKAPPLLPAATPPAEKAPPVGEEPPAAPAVTPLTEAEPPAPRAGGSAVRHAASAPEPPTPEAAAKTTPAAELAPPALIGWFRPVAPSPPMLALPLLKTLAPWLRYKVRAMWPQKEGPSPPKPAGPRPPVAQQATDPAPVIPRPPAAPPASRPATPLAGRPAPPAAPSAGRSAALPAAVTPLCGAAAPAARAAPSRRWPKERPFCWSDAVDTDDPAWEAEQLELMRTWAGRWWLCL